MPGSNLKLALQQEPAESGLACICMLLNYYGCAATLESLRIQFPVRKRGPTPAGLRAALENLDFTACAMAADAGELMALTSPAILLWDDARFVVMLCGPGDALTIFDPAGEISSMPLARAARHFSGVVLRVQVPTDLSRAAQRLAPEPVSYPRFWLIEPAMGTVPTSIEYVENAAALYRLPDAQRAVGAVKQSAGTKAVPGRTRPDDPREIHRQLFTGIYRDPGAFRTVNLTRWRRRYLPFDAIADCYAQLCSMLESEHFMTRLDRAGFIERAARYYSDFMAVHPFVDGNGRTFQRLFAQLAALRGQRLNVSGLSRTEWSAAFYRSQDGDAGFLQSLLSRALGKKS